MSVAFKKYKRNPRKKAQKIPSSNKCIKSETNQPISEQSNTKMN